MDQKVSLITGASSGVGYAIAQECASHGYTLILAARRQDQSPAGTISSGFFFRFVDKKKEDSLIYLYSKQIIILKANIEYLLFLISKGNIHV